MTTEMCMDYCRDRAYTIAGTQNGRECYCGNEISPKIKLQDSDCTSPCAGNSEQICGGSWILSIHYL